MAAEIVTVWWDHRVPARLRWQERRWRVSDVPTRLVATPDTIPVALTHPPERTVGWRFQATAENDGEAVVFDIEPVDGQWVVRHTWN